MKCRLMIVFLMAVIAILFLTLSFSNKSKAPFVKINDQIIQVEVTQTPEAKAQGLSDRESLPFEGGMLFIYSQPGIYSFWMNKMKFNLDFIFINKDLVVDLAGDVPFPREGEKPQTVRAKKPFDSVLETESGIIDKAQIKIGDKVFFSLE